MKAILTGHTRGLGAAIGAELLARGIPVLGVARGSNPELAARFPALLQQQELDLADPASVNAWLATAPLQRFLADAGQALLINNAGMVQPVGPLGTQEPALVAQAVSLNVTSPLMLSAAFASAGSATERRILHISSGAGRHPYPGWSVYCATKAALDLHAHAALLDQVPGLRICSLAPGVIDTDMQALIRTVPLERFPIRERFDALKNDGHLSSPADCARRLVDFLLDEGFGQNPVADLRD
jgi:benzil reductase ((S)-benzoin forming)